MAKASRITNVALTLVAVGLAGWFLYRLANATAAHTLRIEFATLPESDEPLRAWLAGQPGVTAASVRRDGGIVVVEFVLHPRDGQPSPDPVGEAGRLGYGGLRRYTGEVTSRW